MNGITVSIYVEGAERPVRQFRYDSRSIEAARAQADRLKEQIKSRGWNHRVEIEGAEVTP